MDLNGVINGIMPEVHKRSEESFAVYRSGDGEWHYEFSPQDEDNRRNWLESIKKQDPLVAVYRGVDFAVNDYADVFDEIISQRVIDEYHAGDKSKELYAIYKFFEDNTCEFTQKVMDYLAMRDKPLSVLKEMCPFDMTTDFDGWSYNRELSTDAIIHIEGKVSEQLRTRKSQNHKRTIDGYEEINGIYVNNHYDFIGCYHNDENKFMVAEFRCDNNHRLMEMVFDGITYDYLEALEKFNKLVEFNVSVVKSDRLIRRDLDNVEQLTLTEKHCVPNGLSGEFNGKLIIIKPDALPPERRTADYQLQFCTGGLGANSKLSGNAVYCKDLFYGNESRFERHNVLGVADVRKLPKWAKEKFAVFCEIGKTTSFKAKLKEGKEKVKRNKAQKKDNPQKSSGVAI